MIVSTQYSKISAERYHFNHTDLLAALCEYVKNHNLSHIDGGQWAIDNDSDYDYNDGNQQKEFEIVLVQRVVEDKTDDRLAYQLADGSLLNASITE